MSSPESNRKNKGRAKNRWNAFRTEFADKVDFLVEYEAMGIEVVGDPDANGWVACRSHEKLGGGEDRNPSAAINIHTGVYKDFKIPDKAMSIADFAVAIGRYEEWRIAQREIAKKYNCKTPRMSDNHPAADISFIPWNPVLVSKYCSMKPPITPEGLQRAGAQLGTWKGVPSIILEVFDECMNVVGYYALARHGGEFEGGGKSRQKSAIHGIIGRPAAARLATSKDLNETFYWCEGGPDVLAAYSAFPDSSHFFTNANGCAENLSDSQKAILSKPGLNVVLLSDADVAGLAGAFKRATSLRESGIRTSVLTPTEKIEEKSGTDLRDYLAANKPSDADQMTAKWHEHDVQAKQQELEEQVQAKHEKQLKAEARKHQKRLDKLDIKVLSSSQDGEIAVECLSTRQRRVFKSISHVTYLSMCQLCGPMYTVNVTEDIDNNDKIHHCDVRLAIAAVASTLHGSLSPVGAGMWEMDGQVAIVKGGDFFTLEERCLVQHAGPVYKDFLVDYDQQDDWCDTEKLADYIRKARDPEWRHNVHCQLLEYVHSWPWASNGMDLVACGLVYATWMQVMWKWRPIVYLTGESNSGKTYFLQFLSELFLGITEPLGNSSVAGVMQHIKNDSLPLLLDEFDTNRAQRAFMQVFRASSRGQKSVKGTADQGGRQYNLKHIPWLSGIFTIGGEQADVNRMIELTLVSTERNTIASWDQESIRDLGYQILACVMQIAHEAVVMSEELTQIIMGEERLPREWESYSVVFSALGAMNNLDAPSVRELMKEHVETVTENQPPAATDQDELLRAILSAPIRMPPHEVPQYKTVGEILLSSSIHGAKFMEYLGICRKMIREEDYCVIAVTHLTDSNGLLGDHEKWQGARIGPVLKRLKQLEVEMRTVHINGVSQHCAVFKTELLKAYVT